MTRVLRKLLAPTLVVVALIAPPSAAAQGVPCWRQVINDWWDNGRVDRVYAPKCYREALARLPEDMQAYSDAPDAIERALREALRVRTHRRPQGEDGRTRQDEPAPRTGPPGSGGLGGEESRFREGFGDGRGGSQNFDDFNSPDGSSFDGGSGGNGGGAGGGGGGGGDGDDGAGFGGRSDPRSDTPRGEAEPSQGLFREALDRIGPNDPSSFPLPLLILAAIALLLLALATAGFLSRRLHARRPRLFGK